MYDSSPNMSTTSLSDNEEEVIGDALVSLSPYTNFDASPAQWSSPRRRASSTTMRQTNSIASTLPPEILIHILRQLHSSRDIHSSLLVSRAWCECAVELLWHRPTLSNISRFVHLLQVIGSEDKIFSYESFIRRLNFLNFSREVTDGLFMRLDKCLKLERLTMPNCTEITEGALHHVFQKLTNLVVIDLSNVNTASDQSIIHLAESASRLQGLNFGNCRNLTDNGILSLAENCHLLRRVKLSGLKLITDKSVCAIARSCPLLLELDLNGCSKITDVAIRDLWVYSAHLRELKLGHCTDITDAAFPASRSRLSDNTGARSYSPRSTATYQELPPLKLKRVLDHLRMLDLTACHQITDDAIEGIVSHAPKIRHLFLGKCSQLTDSAVESISKLGKYLHYLHLGHAASITDRSVTTLARSCTRLRYIDLACCPLLTDLSASELAVLPKLKRIGLVRVSNLTDQGINSLAEGQTSLERIHLSYCDAITTVAVHQLLQRLTKVTHLSLTGIPAFRHPDLQRFCRAPPKEFNTSQRAAFCVYSGQGVHELRKHLAETMFCTADDQDLNYEPRLENESEISGPVNHVNGVGAQTDDYDFVDEIGRYDNRYHSDNFSAARGVASGGANGWQDRTEARDYTDTQAYYSTRPVSLAPPFEEFDNGSDVSTPNLSRRGSMESLERIRDSPPRTHIFGQDILIEQSSTPSSAVEAIHVNGGKKHDSNAVDSSSSSNTIDRAADRRSHDIVDDRLGDDISIAGPGPSTMAQEVQHRGRKWSPYLTRNGSSQLDTTLQKPSNSQKSFGLVPFLTDVSRNIDHHSSLGQRPPSSSQVNESRQSGATSQVAISHAFSSSLYRNGNENADLDVGRGRSVRRSLRNTLSAAEHYASSLFFGRGSSSNRDSVSTPYRQ